MNVGLDLTVYVLHGQDETLYVGITSNLAGRLAAHLAKSWGPAIRRIELHPKPAGADPHRFEMSYINQHRPRYNIEADWKKHVATENPCHFARYCGDEATQMRRMGYCDRDFTVPVCDLHATPALVRARRAA